MLQGFQGYLKWILVHQRPNNKVLSPCIAPEPCRPGHGPLGRLGRRNILFWVRSHPHWTATSCQTCPTRRYLTANRSRGTTMVMERAANCRFRGERRCRQVSVTFWQEQSKIGCGRKSWYWRSTGGTRMAAGGTLQCRGEKYCWLQNLPNSNSVKSKWIKD